MKITSYIRSDIACDRLKMSVQGSQKIRSSPLTGLKQGPLKAILPVASLMRKDPIIKKSKSNSPTSSLRSRFSPDGCLSGQTSPGSLSFKGAKSKSPSSKGDILPSGGTIRRTASLDAIYLKGQWPREAFYMHFGILQVDKATQTDDWMSERRQRHSESAASEDGKLEKYIRYRLQRATKEGQGSKLGLRVISPPLQSGAQTPPSAHLSGPQSPVQGIAINVTTRSALGRPLIRNSVEGLNQEIERLVLKDFDDRYLNSTSIPEGHRAPLADLLRQTRSVNTQTPGGNDEMDLECCSSEASSRDSLSPMLTGNIDTPLSYIQGSRGTSPDDLCFGTSPHINKFLAREPPDGCEKVSLRLEENRLELSQAPPHFIPLKPITTIEFKQSLGSAFQPLQHQTGAAAAAAVAAAVTTPATTTESLEVAAGLVNGECTPEATGASQSTATPGHQDG